MIETIKTKIQELTFKVIEFLIEKSGWYNTILNTDIPNKPPLLVRSITIFDGKKETTYKFTY